METFRDFSVSSVFGARHLEFTPLCMGKNELSSWMDEVPVSSWLRETRVAHAVADRQWRKVFPVCQEANETVWLSDTGDEFTRSELLEWLLSGGVYAERNGYGMNAIAENERLTSKVSTLTAELTNLKRLYAGSENANTQLNEDLRQTQAKLRAQETPETRTILEEAGSIVDNGTREHEYGSPQDSFSRIARLWSAYWQSPVSPREVADLMILLKVARGTEKRDTLVDIAGYARCLERLSEEPPLF